MLAAPDRHQSPYLDIAAALDPVVFAQQAGFQPHPWQANLLRSTASRILLNCSRQSGKSTTTALIALHQALYQPGSLILILATRQPQAGELLRKATEAYALTDALVPTTAESVPRLEFENGSRVLSLPARDESIRGYSNVALLLFDEAARIPDSLYLSALPMLAVSGGRLIAMSTPFGKLGWWSDAWHGAGPWERYEVPATMVPHISPAFLEEAQRSMGSWWYQQEFLCHFLDAETQAFRTEDIDAAFTGVQAWQL